MNIRRVPYLFTLVEAPEAERQVIIQLENKNPGPKIDTTNFGREYDTLLETYSWFHYMFLFSQLCHSCNPQKDKHLRFTHKSILKFWWFLVWFAGREKREVDLRENIKKRRENNKDKKPLSSLSAVIHSALRLKLDLRTWGKSIVKILVAGFHLIGDAGILREYSGYWLSPFTWPFDSSSTCRRNLMLSVPGNTEINIFHLIYGVSVEYTTAVTLPLYTSYPSLYPQVTFLLWWQLWLFSVSLYERF